MLDLAILGLLEERELHGYDIRKQLRESLGLLANVSFGSIYPALARLEHARAVVAVEATESALDSIPSTGSLSGEKAIHRARRHSATHGRRSKKVYKITDEGRRQFAELLAGSVPEEDARSFGVRMSFARHLGPETRLALLERRRIQLGERLEKVRAASTGSHLDVYARSVVEHTADGVEGDLRWIERLIDTERQNAVPERPTTGGTAGARASNRNREKGERS